MKIIIKESVAELAKELDEAADRINKQLPLQIFRALTLLETQIKSNIRTESGLNVRSGTLLNSIQKEMQIKNSTEVIGKVGPEGSVPYAAVHEYGHKFPARFITPRNKLALSWSGPGGTFFSKGHEIPSFEVKARPYLAPAMEKLGPMIERDLGILVKQEIEKGK